ncbi:MAG: hypothetical protein JWP89_1922 [Schlesneria sp.]|nr:hypothetical protein [Schlesneria sp.]
MPVDDFSKNLVDIQHHQQNNTVAFGECLPADLSRVQNRFPLQLNEVCWCAHAHQSGRSLIGCVNRF